MHSPNFHRFQLPNLYAHISLTHTQLSRGFIPLQMLLVLVGSWKQPTKMADFEAKWWKQANISNEKLVTSCDYWLN